MKHVWMLMGALMVVMPCYGSEAAKPNRCVAKAMAQIVQCHDNSEVEGFKGLATIACRATTDLAKILASSRMGYIEQREKAIDDEIITRMQDELGDKVMDVLDDETMGATKAEYRKTINSEITYQRAVMEILASTAASSSSAPSTPVLRSSDVLQSYSHASVVGLSSSASSSSASSSSSSSRSLNSATR